MDILEAEADFKNPQTLLEERMAEMGARVIFLPKFHPEFNPFECVYRYKIHPKNDFLINPSGMLPRMSKTETQWPPQPVS